MLLEGLIPMVFVLHPSGPDVLPFPGTQVFPVFAVSSGRTLCLHPQKDIEMNSWDFPGGSVVKTLHSQCKEPGFNVWLGN